MTLTTVALCTLCLTFLEPMVYIWININENIDRTYFDVALNLKRPGHFFQMVSDSSWQPFEGHPLSNSVILFQCVLLCVTTLIFPETWPWECCFQSHTCYFMVDFTPRLSDKDKQQVCNDISPVCGNLTK